MSWVLVLIAVAFFFALGLEPAASWLVNRKLPRWLAVTLVVVVTFTRWAMRRRRSRWPPMCIRSLRR
jgi:protein-S-isoprenylcysteine O-methyltransferase Ste14